MSVPPGERVGSTILVLKGSRVREYLQENQRLLAAPRGQTIRTAYNLTWVSDQVDLNLLEPGAQALIIFSDHPYGALCPVRYASVVAVRRSDDYLDLELRVEEFVVPRAILGGGATDPPSGGVIQPEIFENGGQKVFVQAAPEDLSLPERADADAELETWKRVVAYLTASVEEREYFRAARFFRPLSFRRADDEEIGGKGGDLLLGSGAALSAGTRYRLELYSYNLHLPEHEIAKSFFRLGGGGAFSLGQSGGKGGESPHLMQDGRLRLEFVPVRQGVHALEVSTVPRSEVSSFLRLEDLEVVGNVPDSPVPGRQGGKGIFMLPGEEALRLDDWLARRLDMSNRDRLKLFEDFFEPWCEAHEVAERYAAIAFEEKEWEKVADALQGRDGLSEYAQYLCFLACCEQERPANLVDTAEKLAWSSDHEDFFDHFLAVVPKLDFRTRTELANRLPFSVWGDEKSCRFLHTLMDGECDPSVISMIVGALEEYQGLFGMNADDVLDWLVQKARFLDYPGPELIQALVTWSARATRTEEVVELMCENLLSPLYRKEKDCSAVIGIAENLRPALSFPQRFHLDTSAADVLLDGAGNGEGSEEVEAAMLQLISLLDECLERGRTWEGEDVVWRLRGILKTRSTISSDLRLWGEEAVGRFKEYVEEWKPYRSKLMDEVQQRAMDLGDRFSGRTLHIFSGHQGSELGYRYEKLEELTALPVNVHRLEDRGVMNGLRPERDVVIVITRWSSHKDTDYVQKQCGKKKITHHLMPQRVVSPAGIINELATRVQ